ncbi:hypothetical protein FRB96_005358 [Tulasnella sp. 330]|nr:hypothetical protein FRB96_005358 [Tulasnella sp. 330]
MTVSLPSLSTIISGSMPFYNASNGSFTLPPLHEGYEGRRGSITIDTNTLRKASHHTRSRSAASDLTSPSDSGSPILPSLESLSLSSSAAPSSSSGAPKVPHKTRPSSPYSHPASHARRQSIASKPTAPAFKLVPQPMIDPSKRPIRSTDALVVFPPAAGISQASQRKAKLLIGRDVERYFQLLTPESGARAYAYKVVWETRWSSDALVKVMNKTDMAGGRRPSLAMDCN